MRGIETNKSSIRHRVFTEVARFAYENGTREDFARIPFKILPGELSHYRSNIFIERAVLGERLRSAMGMPVRDASQSGPLFEGLEKADTAETYYTPPLIDIISFACNACPEKRVIVTEGCMGCLEHPCMEVCPKEAITMKHGRSHIDQSKCIKCGKCADVCQYNAIIKQERPCTKACGAGAIGSDSEGRAVIDHTKCVSCGQCLVHCPFGAIVDKSQIYQCIKAINNGDEVFAAIAPAFVGQFGEDADNMRVRPLLKRLGFADAREVAIGADLCTVAEARDFIEEVPEKIPFMATSCCPAWAAFAKRNYPGMKENISMALTPMVLTARMIKKRHPGCKVAFIGPCSAKKLEAMRHSIRSDVDFVLTFEEVAGMMEAKDVCFEDIREEEFLPLDFGSGDGCGFAHSGGVAEAVKNRIKQIDPNREVKIARAEGLSECKKMLALAKAGKYNGYLLEGMGCPGGCVGGAGTIKAPEATEKLLMKNVAAKQDRTPIESRYLFMLENLEERTQLLNADFSENAEAWEHDTFYEASTRKKKKKPEPAEAPEA
ncbi:MAG: 4Fe-4S dicluster domain-containing protein [Clostridia bacterium]|nr:4Fe-4S dicluster domain-containing protein [Clostridia bacterium]